MERRGISDLTAAELLGHERLYKDESINYYKLKSDEVVTMKFSHLYPDGVGYWYGVTPSALQKYQSQNISALCLILGYEGVLKIPFKFILDYMKNADKSKNENGGIKHYHLRIKYDDSIKMYNKFVEFDVSEYLIFDEEIIMDDLNKKSMDQIEIEARKFSDYANQYTESEKRSKIRKESKAQKQRIAKLEKHTCQVCGFYQEYVRNKKLAWIIQVDHIIDKSKGGGETIDNLWVLCPNCHSKKTYGIIEINKEEKTVKENGRFIDIRDNHLRWNKG
ncbi:HNH endonuclease [Paenibacillus amylolyticus]|uniref:HNH endonuclease n=1 Tax=Paenibacillus amylolyticus TaxID=1451 RepID=UPI002499D755|nr:HNH endonuclease signature motif containing protein [Paenibacillus amylolyticus]WFA82704.1 HNH endonuclease [Paenibacillus amylolyticus]